MKIKHAACLMICVSCLSPSISSAELSPAEAQLVQKMEGTLYVTPHRESADGQLQACGLEFSTMKRDFSTLGGSPTKTVGSIYFRISPNNNIHYVLKLGVFDGFTFDKPIAPSNAFIRAPKGKAPVKAIRALAEKPGFALFIGGLDDEVTAAFKSIVDSKKIEVGFNRKPGQMDVVSLVDLRVLDTKMENAEVVRQYSDEPVDDFTACFGELINTLKSKQ